MTRITPPISAGDTATIASTSTGASPCDPLDRAARRRVRAKLGWYQHAFVFVAVNALLVWLSWRSDETWALYPMLGWGLGLALHGARVWLAAPGAAWRERMVQRERAALARTMK